MEAIEFLRHRAEEELRNVEIFLESYKREKDKRALSFALIDLSFTCSYYQFAAYYQNHPSNGAVTFPNLLEKNADPPLEMVMRLLKATKLGETIEEVPIVNLFQEVRKIIKGD